MAVAAPESTLSTIQRVTGTQVSKMTINSQGFVQPVFPAHLDALVSRFKSKYHPEEYGKRKAEQKSSQKKRLEVFMELMNKGWLDNFSLDGEKSDKILRFLDAEQDTGISKTTIGRIVTEDLKLKKTPAKFITRFLTNEQKLCRLATCEDMMEMTRTDPEWKDKIITGDETWVYGYDPETKPQSAEWRVVIKLEGGTDLDLQILDLPPSEIQQQSESKYSSSPRPPKDGTNKDSSSDSDSESGSRAGSDDEGPKPEAPEKGDKKEEGEKKEENGEEDEEEPKEPKPRPLHKTQSIFLRNLAPNITKKEVELICKKYPGYLRVAIADPQPDRRFFRRGWVTFKPNVNIKDICWDLNNIRIIRFIRAWKLTNQLVQLRDYELGAIVNRDLTRRIRMVNGITSHKAVARSDVKTAARLVHHLDSQKGVWGEEGPNPLLQNITDYLIEEASAEEEELLGVSANAEDHEEESVLERDEPLLQVRLTSIHNVLYREVLDRLVLYLRVVHSVDYYNCSDYPSEDEMPNRCGLLHVRGSAPSSKVTQQEINSYLEPFNQKIQAFLQPQTRLSEEEALRMGKKDSEVEVEKFVQSNTQELGKDKWLCPLSGKKFKGPEFVRKHIFNKHSDKVEEVKEEVEYFNNYLMDPRRPQLPEHPANKGRPDMMGPPFGGPPFMRPMPPAMGFPGFGRPDMFGRPFKRTYGGRYSDPRKIIPYRDLDAPEDADI
ncbi:SRRT [Cordylochernes scorpioides]|uniref:Serrate RNA effector molecule homolog n=1 Tax=Cordylochernes scorpioides TaxID=51811 RepID=A0ABY6KBY8_9ARAC|nr:SRRT [Cordylochernes scorpioides]